MLYDTETMSLWSPTLHTCVAGERTGVQLKPAQTYVTTWPAWKALHPETTVLLGTNPVLRLDYEANPAAPPNYMNDARLMFYPAYGFDVEKTPMRLKARVFGVTGPDGKTFKAYEEGLLREAQGEFKDEISGQAVSLSYDGKAGLLTAKTAGGEPLLTETMIWMAWAAVHPKTEVWQEAKLRAALYPAAPSGTADTDAAGRNIPPPEPPPAEKPKP